MRLLLRVTRSLASRWRRWRLSTEVAALGVGATVGQHVLVLGGHRITIGDEFSCWRLCTLAACDDGRIVLGRHVSFNANVYLNACGGGSIEIGDDVLIGPNVVMRTSDHVFADTNTLIRLQGHQAAPIVVERNVWIGANATITGGVRIGEGAIVAAGAVVVSDVEPQTLVGGVPAKLIRRRDQSGSPEGVR